MSTAPFGGLPMPLRSLDAMTLCAAALELGLVLHAYDSTDETWRTAGPVTWAGGRKGWALYGYRRGAGAVEADESCSSARRLAVAFVGHPGVGKWRALVAARAAMRKAGLD